MGVVRYLSFTSRPSLGPCAQVLTLEGKSGTLSKESLAGCSGWPDSLVTFTYELSDQASKARSCPSLPFHELLTPPSPARSATRSRRPPSSPSRASRRKTSPSASIGARRRASRRPTRARCPLLPRLRSSLRGRSSLCTYPQRISPWSPPFMRRASDSFRRASRFAAPARSQHRLARLLALPTDTSSLRSWRWATLSPRHVSQLAKTRPTPRGKSQSSCSCRAPRHAHP